MKIIEFPKNNNIEYAGKIAKLDIAYELIEIVIATGCDFHVMIPAEASKVLFAQPETDKPVPCILTSNLEKAKQMFDTLAELKTIHYYPIRGDEF